MVVVADLLTAARHSDCRRPRTDSWRQSFAGVETGRRIPERNTYINRLHNRSPRTVQRCLLLCTTFALPHERRQRRVPSPTRLDHLMMHVVVMRFIFTLLFTSLQIGHNSIHERKEIVIEVSQSPAAAIDLSPSRLQSSAHHLQDKTRHFRRRQ